MRAYIGLGANLGDARAQVLAACAALAALPASTLHARSPLYRSAPVGGPPGQLDYINAVAALDTGLAASELLARLHVVEAAHGRERREHWGPRTLDLDLLLYGDATIATPELTVPHPRLHQRTFVLYPLADLAPELHIPGRGAVSDLISRCPSGGLERME